jgi:hypothetical protein
MHGGNRTRWDAILELDAKKRHWEFLISEQGFGISNFGFRNKLTKLPKCPLMLI